MIRSICTLLIFSTALFWGCDNDDETIISTNSLGQYIETSGLTLVREQLIACAAGGQKGYLEEPADAISIFFYPEGDASDFRYFETESANIEADNFDLYIEQKLDDLPFFNGYLRRFVRQKPDAEKWCVVTFIKNGNLHISDPIRIKEASIPTEFSPELVQVDQTPILSPQFSWLDGAVDENIIYFHAITNSNGDLVSGTYTVEKNFKFYDLTNVVLNIRDVSPAPMLEPESNYTFTLMGVSDDNWVNLIIEKNFDTF